MSPSRKLSGPRGPRRSHVARKHGRGARKPRAPLPPTEVAPISIMFGGHHVGDLHVRPGIDAELVTRALVTVTGCLELSASLAELGPHRFALAVRAAAAAVGGGAM